MLHKWVRENRYCCPHCSPRARLPFPSARYDGKRETPTSTMREIPQVSGGVSVLIASDSNIGAVSTIETNIEARARGHFLFWKTIMNKLNNAESSNISRVLLCCCCRGIVPLIFFMGTRKGNSCLTRVHTVTVDIDRRKIYGRLGHRLAYCF